MNVNEIYNEDCKITLLKMKTGSVDLVLTSPPYNTNKRAGGSPQDIFPTVRYDIEMDRLTNDEYTEWITGIFKEFDRVLKPNGVVLWNVNYGNLNTEAVFLSVADILKNTNFTIADVICWHKKSAMPNCESKTKLTRVWEFVFVFCRENEAETFFVNRRVTSIRPTGQKMYENLFNYIVADNNDGICPYNRSTYSTDLCRQLLKIYGKLGGVVYDPFMGSGTTAVACLQSDMNYIGSELSKNQVKYAVDRINSVAKGVSYVGKGKVEIQDILF